MRGWTWCGSRRGRKTACPTSRNCSSGCGEQGFMLRLSKKADYALMAMKHLAVKTDVASTSAREIAEQYDIPVELMAKVLQRLGRSGLLTSPPGTRGRQTLARSERRGPRAHYTLARSKRLISVSDIIQAIDGPLTVTACSSTDEQCEQFEKCNVRDPLWRINARILAPLATCSLEEISSEAPPPDTAVIPVSLTRGMR